MASSKLESRVAILEAELTRLKNKIETIERPAQPWWEKIAGTFADDPIYDEAMKMGRQYRKSQKPKSTKLRKD
ncbi:MAG: hypothetical protein AB1757_23365 [Acidobacteriota bacterium]